MNFMSKISKKPSKQHIRPKKRDKNRNNEDEYIEVDLEIEEEERPPIPMFIGGPESGNPGMGGGDFDDEFFDGAVEDDLSLGEEANIFYDKQRNNSFRQNSSKNVWQPSGAGGSGAPGGSNYLTPSPQTPGEMPMYGIAAPAVDPQNLNHSYPPTNYHIPPPIMIPSGYPPNQISMDNQQIAQSHAMGGIYYSGRPNIPTPHYGQTGYIHPSATPINSNNNYLGLSDLEMIEFHQLIANGVPEMDAIHSIQYNRMATPTALLSTPLSRKTSGIPPIPATVDEEDEVYQMILKESIEEERRRQERMRNANDEELTQDEAMKIAIQESYDDYERKMRGDNSRHSHQSYGSPSLSSNGYSGPSTGRSATKTSGKPPKVANSIEKANEDALRQAILLSMQESSNNSALKRTQSMNSQFSHPPSSYQSSIPQAAKGLEPLDTRVFSVATRSGSSDHYNDYVDYGLVPDHLPHSPYHGSADVSGMGRQPHLLHQSHHNFLAPRAPPPSSSLKPSGNYSPAHFGSPPAPSTGLNFYASHDSNAPLPSGNAAQMILSRRNQSFSAGESLRSRSSDSQEPRNRRMNQSLSDIIPDSQYY